MNAKAETERDLIIKLLEYYKDFPCLWDLSNKDYCNRDARNQAYMIMLDVLKKLDSAATLKTLKNKLENMRTSYKRERKKVEASKTSGAGSDELHMPSLWYYEHLSFLDDKTTPKTEIIDNMELNNDEEPAAKRERVKKKNQNDILKKQSELLESAKLLLSGDGTSADAFGNSVSSQLKELPKVQRCLAEKLIGEVLFYAKLEVLTFETSINIKRSQPLHQPSLYESLPPPQHHQPSPYAPSPTPSPQHRLPSPYRPSPSPSPQHHQPSPYQPSPSPSPQHHQPSPYPPYQPSPSPSPQHHQPSPYALSPTPSPQHRLPSLYRPSPSPYRPSPSPYRPSPSPSPQHHQPSPYQPSPSPSSQHHQPSPLPKHSHRSQSLPLPQHSQPSPSPSTLPQLSLSSYQHIMSPHLISDDSSSQPIYDLPPIQLDSSSSLINNPNTSFDLSNRLQVFRGKAKDLNKYLIFKK